jgi:hypothetical protein
LLGVGLLVLVTLPPVPEVIFEVAVVVGTVKVELDVPGVRAMLYWAHLTNAVAGHDARRQGATRVPIADCDGPHG